ncbi:hypothetical protein [Helicobacter jaachi]|uniref:hypothetical protein n=1 Tax=Helicobacter jaachi TaxID=1677920 RepID=UPI000A5E9310|nr:hypothetical protein [Helicobacter jaachi]
MKNVALVCLLFISAMVWGACSKKQPVGEFQSVECRTICTSGQCSQQCIGASGDLYKK